MSRIGKKPITIPSGVTVAVSGDGVQVTGPKGSVTKALHPSVSITVKNDEVVVEPKDDTKIAAAMWGTIASHITNMVSGVTEGYAKKLIIEGVGYRAETQGNKLVMQLGYSHPVEMTIPEEIEVAIEKNVLTVSGINKETVGQFAANVRSKREPEPYKGKGVRYEDEVIRRKEGKKSA